MARNCAYVASMLMRHMCDHDWHGYTQGNGRWGDGEGYCYVEVDGETFQLAQGDRDCSSAVISCWREALRGTAYEGCLDGATYTGNMRDVFTSSGLFEVWVTNSTSACIGDIYLNDSDHTAMCVDDGSGDLGYDALGEFSISENGTIYGVVGDQTGGESSVHGYYNFPWDCTLHYNGKADGGGSSSPSVSQPEPSYSSGQDVRYRLHALNGEWLPWMEGLVDTGGSSDDYAGTPGGSHDMLMVEGIAYRVHTVNGDWLPWVTKADENDDVYGMAGNWGEAIDGIQINSDRIRYRTQTAYRDGWLDWVVGCNDTDDGYAGIYGEPVDRLQIVGC